MNVPLLDAFNALVPDSPCPRRQTSVTTLQALALLNGSLSTTEAEYLAERVRRESGNDVEAQVRRAFNLTLIRDPSDQELRRVRTFFAESKADAGAKTDALAGLCRVLFGSNEFIYVD